MRRFFEVQVRPLIVSPTAGRQFLVGCMQEVIEKFGVETVRSVYDASMPKRKDMDFSMRLLARDLENVIRKAELGRARVH